MQKCHTMGGGMRRKEKAVQGLKRQDVELPGGTGPGAGADGFAPAKVLGLFPAPWGHLEGWPLAADPAAGEQLTPRTSAGCRPAALSPGTHLPLTSTLGPKNLK